jgi:hypothetical protein
MANVRLQESIDKREEWIAYLCTLSDKKLVRRLDLIRQQLQMACDQNKPDDIELMMEWERQTIAARIIKQENNIPDVPSEMELWKEEEKQREAEYDRLEKMNEERKEVLKKFNPIENDLPPVEEKEENKEEDKGEEQLRLF